MEVSDVLVRVLLLWDCLFWLGLPYTTSGPIFTPFRPTYSSRIRLSDSLQVCIAVQEPAEWAQNKRLIYMLTISLSEPTHRTPIQNRPKTCEIANCSIFRIFFFENFLLATRSSHRSASKTPCLTMLYHNISWTKFSRLVPGDSNLEHRTQVTAPNDHISLWWLALLLRESNVFLRLYPHTSQLRTLPW